MHYVNAGALIAPPVAQHDVDMRILSQHDSKLPADGTQAYVAQPEHQEEVERWGTSSRESSPGGGLPSS